MPNTTWRARQAGIQRETDKFNTATDKLNTAQRRLAPGIKRHGRIAKFLPSKGNASLKFPFRKQKKYLLDRLLLILYMPTGSIVCYVSFWMRVLEQRVLMSIKEKAHGPESFPVSSISVHLIQILFLPENLSLLIVKRDWGLTLCFLLIVANSYLHCCG